MDNLDIIVQTKFGSHLYGTSTPDSDVDYKGVFMPSPRQICLGQIPKSHNHMTRPNKADGIKNTSDDVDTEIYSLHYFVKLALEGQTVALDMLHAPDDMILTCSPLWDEIVLNRKKFYTKNLKAFIGYARRQASKYGIKGSRLNAAKLVVDYLEHFNNSDKLSTAWKDLPSGDHLHLLGINQNGIQQYQVCGKTLQETQTIGYTIEILKRFYKEYGKRAELAAQNKGIDWKAVSHALRAAYQVRQLLVEGTIVFPLKEANYLRKVKQGLTNYASDAAPTLERVMEEVEGLSLKSTLPEKSDYKFWNNFLEEKVRKHVLQS